MIRDIQDNMVNHPDKDPSLRVVAGVMRLRGIAEALCGLNDWDYKKVESQIDRSSATLTKRVENAVRDEDPALVATCFDMFMNDFHDLEVK